MGLANSFLKSGYVLPHEPGHLLEPDSQPSRLRCWWMQTARRRCYLLPCPFREAPKAVNTGLSSGPGLGSRTACTPHSRCPRLVGTGRPKTTDRAPCSQTSPCAGDPCALRSHLPQGPGAL